MCIVGYVSSFYVHTKHGPMQFQYILLHYRGNGCDCVECTQQLNYAIMQHLLNNSTLVAKIIVPI